MSRKINGIPPVTVINLDPATCNTSDLAEKSVWERLRSRNPLIAKAVNTPVLLVNAKQIDYLTPSDKKKFLNPRAVKQILDCLREEKKEDPWEDLERACSEELWGRYQSTAALGLYHHGPLSDPESLVKIGSLAGGGHGPGLESSSVMDALRGFSGPFIALCSERIYAHARSHSVPCGVALAWVYYHELGHAFLDTASAGNDPYSQLWARVLEESLANAISISCFSSTQRVQTASLTKEQPLEYRGWPFTDSWESEKSIELSELFKIYTRFHSSDLEPHNFFVFRHLLHHDPRAAETLALIIAQSFGNFTLLKIWRHFKRDQHPLAREMLKKIALALLEEGLPFRALSPKGKTLFLTR